MAGWVIHKLLTIVFVGLEENLVGQVPRRKIVWISGVKFVFPGYIDTIAGRCNLWGSRNQRAIAEVDAANTGSWFEREGRTRIRDPLVEDFISRARVLAPYDMDVPTPGNGDFRELRSEVARICINGAQVITRVCQRRLPSHAFVTAQPESDVTATLPNRIGGPVGHGNLIGVG